MIKPSGENDAVSCDRFEILSIWTISNHKQRKFKSIKSLNNEFAFSYEIDQSPHTYEIGFWIRRNTCKIIFIFDFWVNDRAFDMINIFSEFLSVLAIADDLVKVGIFKIPFP